MRASPVPLRLLTQEDCMVCRAEGATVAPQGITA